MATALCHVWFFNFYNQFYIDSEPTFTTVSFPAKPILEPRVYMKTVNQEAHTDQTKSVIGIHLLEG